MKGRGVRDTVKAAAEAVDSEEFRHRGLRMFIYFVGVIMTGLLLLNLLVGDLLFSLEAGIFLLLLTGAVCLMRRHRYEGAVNLALLGGFVVFAMCILLRMHWQIEGQYAGQYQTNAAVLFSTVGVSVLLSGILAERPYQLWFVTGSAMVTLILHAYWDGLFAESITPSEIGLFLVFFFEVGIARTVYRIFRTYHRLQHSSEILAREISHRVKNDMAVTTSLINLEMEQIEGAEAREALDTVRQRLLGLHRVHELLYHLNTQLYVDVSALLRDLVEGYRPLLQESGVEIEYRHDGAVLHTSPTFAIPLGLMVNELITNSQKYAFSPGMTGNISIHSASGEARMLKLEYRDNGKGLKDEVTDLEGFGFLLMKSQIQRYDGSWRLLGERGFGMEISLPVPKAEHDPKDTRVATTAAPKSMIA